MASLHFTSYSRAWWAVLVRGIIAAIFGIIAIANPGGTVEFTVRLLGIVFLIAGIVGVLASTRRRKEPGGMDWLVVPAVVAIVVGLVLIVAPRLTATLLIFLIGLAGVIYGIWEIYNFVRLHRNITGKWMPLLVGIISIIVGLIFMLKAHFIVEAAMWVLGVVALIMGILWIALGFSARNWAEPGEPRPAEPIAKP